MLLNQCAHPHPGGQQALVRIAPCCVSDEHTLVLAYGLHGTHRRNLFTLQCLWTEVLKHA